MMFRRALLFVLLTVAPMQPPPPEDCNEPGDVCFIAFGDQGTLGRDPADRNQHGVAAAMTQWQQDHQTHFVIGLGDNFYLGEPTGAFGAFGCDNAAFKERFENVYSSMPQVFHMIAGNHDWIGTTPRSLLCYAKTHSKWYQPAFYYRFRKGDVEFFALDTPLILKEKFTLAIHEHGADDAQLKWLDRALGASTARWKIVYGHHPIFSNGRYANNEELKEKLLPILKRHYVDVYVSGHDHNQQHITRADAFATTTFVISGAGGRALDPIDVHNALEPNNRLGNANQLEKSRQHGFVSFKISGTQLLLRLVNANGTSRNPQGDVVPYEMFYAAAIDKTRTPGPNTLHLQPIANVCPNRLERGDREFNGNGPQVRGGITLGITRDGSRLTARVTLNARETSGDSSEVAGAWTIYVGEPAPPGMRYSRILSPTTSTFSQVLKGGGRNEVTQGCDGGVHSITPEPGGPVHRLRIVGDTGGSDISSDDDCACDTRIVRVDFAPVTVQLTRQ